MTKILDSIMSIIMVPLDWILAKFFYWLLILWPLKILNALDNAINFITGAGVERILFGVNNVDGKIDIDFFASDSPLKTFYLVSIGIGSTLLMLFFGFKIAHNLFSAKYKNIVKQSSKTLAVGAIVFIIPAIFITLLSLVSSFISLISGGNHAVGTQDINQFRTNNKINIDNIKTFNSNSNFFDQRIPRLYNLKTGSRNTSKSIEDLYQDFETLPQNDSLKIIAKKNFQDYQDIKKKIQGVIFKSHLSNVNQIINNLKIKEKDENKAQQIKDANNYFASINYRISLFARTASQITDQFKSDPQDKKQWMVANYQNFFTNYFYGKKDKINNQANSNTNNINVTSIKSLSTALGVLKDNPHGTLVLSNVLSDYPDSSLAVTFYQLATGSKNTDWENDFNINTTDLANGQLFFGSILIIAACGFLVTICFMALVRLIDLALLVTISPIPVFIAPIDGGERVSLWIKAFSEELLSILGAIIVLRLLGPLGTSYRNFLNTNQGFLGERKLFLLAFFYIASLIAAQKAILTIASIFGIGEGIFASMNLDRSLGFMASLKGYGRKAGSYYYQGVKRTASKFKPGYKLSKSIAKRIKVTYNRARKNPKKLPENGLKTNLNNLSTNKKSSNSLKEMRLKLKEYAINKKNRKNVLLNKSLEEYKNLKTKNKNLLNNSKIELSFIKNTHLSKIFNQKWMKNALGFSKNEYKTFQTIFEKSASKRLTFDEIVLIWKWQNFFENTSSSNGPDALKAKLVFNHILFKKLKALQQHEYKIADKNMMKLAKILSGEEKGYNLLKNKIMTKTIGVDQMMTNQFNKMLPKMIDDFRYAQEADFLLDTFMRSFSQAGKAKYTKNVNETFQFDQQSATKYHELGDKLLTNLMKNQLASQHLFFKRTLIEEINCSNKKINQASIDQINNNLNIMQEKVYNSPFVPAFNLNTMVESGINNVFEYKRLNKVMNSLAIINNFKNILEKINLEKSTNQSQIISKKAYMKGNDHSKIMRRKEMIFSDENEPPFSIKDVKFLDKRIVKAKELKNVYLVDKLSKEKPFYELKKSIQNSNDVAAQLKLIDNRLASLKMRLGILGQQKGKNKNEMVNIKNIIVQEEKNHFLLRESQKKLKTNIKSVITPNISESNGQESPSLVLKSHSPLIPRETTPIVSRQSFIIKSNSTNDFNNVTNQAKTTSAKETSIIKNKVSILETKSLKSFSQSLRFNFDELSNGKGRPFLRNSNYKPNPSMLYLNKNVKGLKSEINNLIIKMTKPLRPISSSMGVSSLKNLKPLNHILKNVVNSFAPQKSIKLNKEAILTTKPQNVKSTKAQKSSIDWNKILEESGFFKKSSIDLTKTPHPESPSTSIHSRKSSNSSIKAKEKDLISMESKLSELENISSKLKPNFFNRKKIKKNNNEIFFQQQEIKKLKKEMPKSLLKSPSLESASKSDATLTVKPQHLKKPKLQIFKRVKDDIERFVIEKDHLIINGKVPEIKFTNPKATIKFWEGQLEFSKINISSLKNENQNLKWYNFNQKTLNEKRILNIEQNISYVNRHILDLKYKNKLIQTKTIPRKDIPWLKTMPWKDIPWLNNNFIEPKSSIKSSNNQIETKKQKLITPKQDLKVVKNLQQESNSWNKMPKFDHFIFEPKTSRKPSLPLELKKKISIFNIDNELNNLTKRTFFEKAFRVNQKRINQLRKEKSTIEKKWIQEKDLINNSSRDSSRDSSLNNFSLKSVPNTSFNSSITGSSLSLVSSAHNSSMPSSSQSSVSSTSSLKSALEFDPSSINSSTRSSFKIIESFKFQKLTKSELSRKPSINLLKADQEKTILTPKMSRKSSHTLKLDPKKIIDPLIKEKFDTKRKKQQEIELVAKKLEQLDRPSSLMELRKTLSSKKPLPIKIERKEVNSIVNKNLVKIKNVNVILKPNMKISVPSFSLKHQPKPSFPDHGISKKSMSELETTNVTKKTSKQSIDTSPFSIRKVGTLPHRNIDHESHFKQKITMNARDIQDGLSRKYDKKIVEKFENTMTNVNSRINKAENELKLASSKNTKVFLKSQLEYLEIQRNHLLQDIKYLQKKETLALKMYRNEDLKNAKRKITFALDDMERQPKFSSNQQNYIEMQNNKKFHENKIKELESEILKMNNTLLIKKLINNYNIVDKESDFKTSERKKHSEFINEIKKISEEKEISIINKKIEIADKAINMTFSLNERLKLNSDQRTYKNNDILLFKDEKRYLLEKKDFLQSLQKKQEYNKKTNSSNFELYNINELLLDNKYQQFELLKKPKTNLKQHEIQSVYFMHQDLQRLQNEENVMKGYKKILKKIDKGQGSIDDFQIINYNQYENYKTRIKHYEEMTLSQKNNDYFLPKLLLEKAKLHLEINEHDKAQTIFQNISHLKQDSNLNNIEEKKFSFQKRILKNVQEEAESLMEQTKTKPKETIILKKMNEPRFSEAILDYDVNATLLPHKAIEKANWGIKDIPFRYTHEERWHNPEQKNLIMNESKTKSETRFFKDIKQIFDSKQKTLVSKNMEWDLSEQNIWRKDVLNDNKLFLKPILQKEHEKVELSIKNFITKDKPNSKESLQNEENLDKAIRIENILNELKDQTPTNKEVSVKPLFHKKEGEKDPFK